MESEEFQERSEEEEESQGFEHMNKELELQIKLQEQQQLEQFSNVKKSITASIRSNRDLTNPNGSNPDKADEAQGCC